MIRVCPFCHFRSNMRDGCPICGASIDSIVAEEPRGQTNLSLFGVV